MARVRVNLSPEDISSLQLELKTLQAKPASRWSHGDIDKIEWIVRALKGANALLEESKSKK